jgi:hypothetical protein
VNWSEKTIVTVGWVDRGQINLRIDEKLIAPR